MAGAEGPDGWPKPLDVGNGQVCASFALDGSWLSLGCPHPAHGFVELNGGPPPSTRRCGAGPTPCAATAGG